MPSKNGVDIQTQIWEGDLFEFERLRDAELLDAQRLEEEERRREEEIRRRKQELSIVYEQKKLSHQK